jgi:hypothetical protein
MQLGGLDQAAEPVAVPRRQVLEEKYSLKQGHVVANRGAAQLKRPGQLSHIHQSCGLPRAKLQETGQGK